MTGGFERPPDGLDIRELGEWEADQARHDGKPQELVMPLLDSAPVLDLGKIHLFIPPGLGQATPEYIRLWPYLWFACQHPDRPADEAMLLDGHCPRCDEEIRRRGLPLPGLPPLPPDAPRFR